MIALLLALSSVAATERPIVTSVGRIAPDRLVVTIAEGRVESGTLEPYVAAAGDEIKQTGDHRTLYRGGQPVGVVVGPENKRHVRTFDRFAGKRINEAGADKPSNWTIVPVKPGGQPIAVTAVARKTFITDAAMQANSWFQMAREHVLTLTLPGPITDGSYRLAVSYNEFAMPDGSETLAFEVSDAMPCPAIHATAVGFRPSDPLKRAYLSWWSGEGVGLDYAGMPAASSFQLIEAATGRVAFTGQAGPTTPADQQEDYYPVRKRPNGTAINRAGGPVTTFDFSGFDTPGTYRLAIGGIGQSKPFSIDADVYEPVWKLALRGLSAHRRDVELTLLLDDGTTMTRPIQAEEVIETTATFDGLDSGRFKRYEKQATGVVNKQAVGGWMDAGDFDTNHSHHKTAQMLSDLVARYPKRLAADDVGTPDSGNGRADLLDEAIWHVDTYRRLQRADGGVPSSIEYREHPNRGEPSWLNSLPVYLTAPATQSNLQYAAAAAMLGRAMNTVGEDGTVYIKSAAKAYEWAEANAGIEVKREEAVAEDRVAASVQLLLVGRDEYRQPFDDLLAKYRDNPWKIVPAEVVRAIGDVLAAEASDVSLSDDDRTALKRLFASSLLKPYVEGSVERSSFGVLQNGWAPFGYGTGSVPTPGTELLLRDLGMMPDELSWSPERVRSAAIGGLAFSLGGNPTNRAYITGLPQLETVDDSHRAVRNILHLDSRFAGQPAPAGVVVYGTLEPIKGDWKSWPIGSYIKNQQALHPAYEQWPAYENLHEFWLWPAQMEYTVHQSIGPVIALAAELDAFDD